MPKLKTILHQLLALTAVILIFMAAPKVPSLVAQASIPGLSLLGPGEGGLPSIIQDTVLEHVKAFIIKRVQDKLLGFINQIQVECPDYLKIYGTDICQRFVGDWKAFLANAVANANLELANEVQSANIPSDWKLTLLQSIVFDRGNINDPGTIPVDNSWGSFLSAWQMDKNLIGQEILRNEGKLAKEESVSKAAEKAASGAFLDDYECVDEAPVAGKPGKTVCLEWKPKIPAGIKERAAQDILLADFDKIVNLESIGQALGVSIATYIENVLDQGLFNARPTGPSNACSGLTGEAKAVCECQGAPDYQACITEKLGIIESFTASPTTIPPEGGSINLSWTTRLTAASCEASGDWSGIKDKNGTEIITLAGPLTTGHIYTYSLTCTGTAGGKETKSANVTVQ